MNSIQPIDHFSRRDLAWLLGSLTALGLVSPVAVGQEEKKLPNAQAVEVALETLCRQKFGKFLTEEQLKRVHRAVMARRNTTELLKKYPLQNSDDPAAAFRADP